MHPSLHPHAVYYYCLRGVQLQVMVDGKTSTVISNTEAGAEEEVEDLLQEQTLKYNPVTYKEHAPRYGTSFCQWFQQSE